VEYYAGGHGKIMNEGGGELGRQKRQEETFNHQASGRAICCAGGNRPESFYTLKKYSNGGHPGHQGVGSAGMVPVKRKRRGIINSGGSECPGHYLSSAI